MTRSCTADRRGAGGSHVVRVFAGLLGISIVAVMIVAGSEVRPGNTAALIRDFPQLQSSVKATIGIALTPAGGSTPVLGFGEWSSGPAWSTIKVPLVVAALRDKQSPHLVDQMKAAITESDNPAAEAIWAGLGDPETAATKVEAVLAETGDFTRVQFRRERKDFSAYGQTEWSLTQQVRFLSVACDHRNSPVLSLMGQIEKAQRWGLGIIGGTRFKGGWGPSRANKYLVRQMGLILTPRGASAVAVAVEPYSGSFADGIATLNRIADWLADHLVMLPTAPCPHWRQ